MHMHIYMALATEYLVRTWEELLLAVYTVF